MHPLEVGRWKKCAPTRRGCALAASGRRCLANRLANVYDALYRTSNLRGTHQDSKQDVWGGSRQAVGRLQADAERWGGLAEAATKHMYMQNSALHKAVLRSAAPSNTANSETQPPHL